MTDQPLLVMTNCPDVAMAKALARRLVEHRLAACVNILPGVQSVYRWQGEIEEAAEVTLSIKTVGARYAELEKAIKLSHPYDVPEIIAIPIARGDVVYLQWIAEETKRNVDI